MVESNLKGLSDKRAYLAVLGSLIKNPMLIDDVDRPLSKADFDTEKFYQIIYVSIYNLYQQGVEKIDEFAIDSYLNNFPEQYKIFNDNEGLTWVSDAMSIAATCNYDYYYHRMRKYSLLRYYEQNGLDTSFLFDKNKLDNADEQQKFDEYTEQQMVSIIEAKLVTDPKANYCNAQSVVSCQAGRGMRELIESLKEVPDYGYEMASLAANTLCRGLRKRCLYLRCACTGSGKTRNFLMDAVNLAVPYKYDLEKKKFVYTGHCIPTVYVGTEGSVEEFQTIVNAAVSGVEEDKIRSNKCTPEEWDRVFKAIEYIEQSPLEIVYTDDYTITDIENIAKKYVIQNNMEVFIFDYIQTTSRMMIDATRDVRVKLQEYQILIEFSRRLKALAERLDIAILTGAQLKSDTKELRYKDEQCLSGAKAIAQKIDIGVILSKPTKSEKKKLEQITSKMLGCPEINLLQWYFKVRSGRLVSVIVASNINLGNMRIKDVFVTDYDFNLIDIDFTKIEEVEQVVENKSRQLITTDDETVNDDDDEDDETPNRGFDW